ncbi:MAG: hypothetical protein HY891_07190 [Deltaproteobacteria bacterium]|nr:hypothetical protein [Deltaproteobacteria bacterium]
MSMKIKIEVGEPRGFDAGDGTNVITGTVIEGSDGSREIEKPAGAITHIHAKEGEKKVDKTMEYWFAVTCDPVKFQDMSLSSLLLIPRYRLKKPPLDMFNDGDTLVMNGVWRADGGQWDLSSIQQAMEGIIEISGMVVVNATKTEG